MIALPVKVWITLILGIVIVKGEVAVENGGYVNVLVSFAQSVPVEGAQQLLRNLEDQLDETSKVLQNAIGIRISKVTVHIPQTWETLENITVQPSSPYQNDDAKADILVGSSSDTVYGHFPHAVQYGSCGTPGRQLVIPVDHLSEDETFRHGQVLAREWLKFRYGVFDENGYPGDDLYPLYYTVPGSGAGDTIITDCSNKPIEYKFYDNENNCTDEKRLLRECSYKPTEESLENVTSSLMYFNEYIPYMQHVCGKDPDHQHSSLSRNKHNALCQGKSVWDVLKNSGDFQNSEFSTVVRGSESEESIEFRYVQEPKPKVVISWEDAVKLKDQKKNIADAVRKFVYDLPLGSSRAIFPFEDKVGPGKNYGKLVEPEDRDFHITPMFLFSGDGCVACAITNALQILEADKSNKEQDPAGTIVIIASSAVPKDDALIQQISSSKACLILIAISDEGAIPDGYEDLAAASSCGTVVALSKGSKDEDLFQGMYEAMESILPETVGDRATETVETKVLKEGSSIEVNVDSTVDKVVFWVFTSIGSYYEAQFNDKEITLDEDVKSAEITVLSYSPKKEGTIKFNLKYKEQEALVQARVTFKPGQYVIGEVFARDLTGADSEQQEPVILYANVRYGEYPIQNAEVIATITRPNAESIHLKMNDDGAGDPDITSNDGVYSRYFTSFSEKGDYTVTVIVKSVEKTTIAGKLTDRGYTTCCGRNVKEGSLQIPDFTKTLQTTFSAKSGRPENGYKPSRILDLMVDSVDGDKVHLKWTAPGAEADSGTAKEYAMKIFCGNGEHFAHCELSKWARVLEKPSPMNYGTGQEVTIQILNTSTALAIGIITINNDGHESDISNNVQISRLTTELEVTSISPEPKKDQHQASPTGTIIGATVAGVIILIGIGGVIIYFLRRKPTNKEQHADDIFMDMSKKRPEVKQVFEEYDHSKKEPSARRVESFPVLLYTHDQIKDFRNKKDDQPLYKVDVPPKPWTSLDGISSLRTKEIFGSDTKSLGSTSTGYANNS